jgi:hypothetical protein
MLAGSWLAMRFTAPLMLVGWLAYASIESGFMPSVDKGGFILDYKYTAVSRPMEVKLSYDNGALHGKHATRSRLRPFRRSFLSPTGVGQGSTVQQPLATAIISGPGLQFPLVLTALPVLLSVLRHRTGDSRRPCRRNEIPSHTGCRTSEHCLVERREELDESVS